MRLVVLLFLFVATAQASCPGMKGEMLKRCECFESLQRPNLEEQKCQEPNDCIVLHDRCGGWAALNKLFKVKYEDLYKNPNFKSQMPEPNVTCHQGMCRLRPKVPAGRGRG
ncbi:MAG: hypothetical protein EP319_03170 [Deltaproteobacteria bacterium]|nr:MAG: hypothetical protein EP319_03170 [Deltaproteobacteria bacterium]